MVGGKSIRLFLADGTPGGLLTAEIMNWTGHIVAAPRSDIASLMKRPEATRTGIYFLIGDDPDGISGQMAYIGEGDDVSKRLYQHARSNEQGGKDFWNRAVILTSKDANLTKAHARYLESRFISLALQAGRAGLANGTSPQPVVLPEADKSDMEFFIEQAKIVLPVLGVNLLRATNTSRSIATPSQNIGRLESPIFTMRVKSHGICAQAQEVDGEFTVLTDSIARREWVGEAAHNYVGLRTKLEQDGTLVPSHDNSTMRFTRNCVFSSPSAAAAVVAGRAANGRTEWMLDETRKTYGEWETEGVEEAMVETTTD